MEDGVLLITELPGLRLFKKGKVRDLYDLGDQLLIVATDRISAFDVVLPNGIPDKGKILTMLSAFWFQFTSGLIENHLITTDVRRYPEPLTKYIDILKSRSMLVKRAERMEIECVVRGYLAGSAWREYSEKGSVCGITLPQGLRESERLPQPIFTPTTKAASGHDLNITEEEVEKMVGSKAARELRQKSLEIYRMASRYAEERGLIVSDTKFEFGIYKDKIILIDELLTPDSSRFWPKAEYIPGRPQRSFDKQFVRDYLEEIGWTKNPPAPSLPEEVVRRTAQKYLEAYKKITGRDSL